MKRVVPVGTVSTSVNVPDDSVLPPPSSFSYCSNPYPCTYFDQFDLTFPPGADRSLMITTRNSISSYARASPNVPFPDYNKSAEVTSFVWAPELTSIRVKHAYAATAFKDEESSFNMEGQLLDQKGRAVLTFAPACFDKFNLSVLLAAAGVSLDAQSLAPKDNGCCGKGCPPSVNTDTVRSTGIVLLVVISYQNIRLKHGQPTYTYTVIPQLKSDWKVYDTRLVDDTHRVVNNRHGVQIVFVQDGEIGEFDFQTLLVEANSALGLLVVATILVDMLMLYVLPHRLLYAEYKFQTTPDFSDVRDEEERKEEEERRLAAAKVSAADEEGGNETTAKTRLLGASYQNSAVHPTSPPSADYVSLQ
jgi:hypothetical protein